MKTTGKKLCLNKETLKKLSTKELRDVAAGAGDTLNGVTGASACDTTCGSAGVSFGGC